MTITTSVNKIIAPGDAIQVDFPYDFIVLAESHMNVYLDGVLEDTANWSMTGLGVQAGGVVTMASAPADGVKVTLLRIVPNTQLVDYSAYGSFPAETHERALDLRVMEAQQLEEAGGRALKAPIDDEGGFSYSLPTPVANRSWKINGTNDAIILTDGDPDQAQSDAAAQVVLAVAAKDASVVAQGLSETAKDASVAAQGLSEDAKDASVVAQGLSEDAATLSEAWAEGTLPGGAGTKSAREWAAEAEVFALSGVGKIQPIEASVAASALTVTLNPTALDFRSPTLTSGAVSTRTIVSPLSLAIPSGATLGTLDGIQSQIALLAIDNAGTIELAVVNMAGGVDLSETGLISTTAIDAASDSADVIYSDTARANVPFRVVGYVESTQATAGAWATPLSTVQGYGGQAMAAMSSLGYGQTWQDVTASRSSGTTYYNTTNKPIQLAIQSSTSAATLTIGGVIAASFSSAAPGVLMPIVPIGFSYTVSASTILRWTELR